MSESMSRPADETGPTGPAGGTGGGTGEPDGGTGGAVSQPRGRWWALAALTLSILVVGLDSYILVTALPTLSAKLGASTSQLQWISAGYTLATAGLLLPAGKLGDRFGRRRALLAGLVIFGVSSVVASRADSAGMLIALRIAMGAGGALIMPMTLALVPVLFPAPAQRQPAVAVTAMGAMVGMPLGPLLAGWLLTHFAWGSIFLINAPVVAIAAAGVAFLVPASQDPEAGRLDWPGALLAAAGVAALVYGVIEQPAYGWDAPVLAGLIGGVVLLAGFAVWQGRARSPLMNLRLFRNRGFTWGSIAFALNGFALSGALFVLSPYLQIVQGNDAAGTGLRLLPMIGAMLAGAAVSEKVLSGRLGARTLIPAGMLISAAGLVVLVFVRAGSGYGVVALALAVFGLGLGVSLPLSVDTVLASLPPGQTGVGNAMSRTLQSIASALGTAILGSVLNAAYRGRLAGALTRLPGPAGPAARASVAGAHAVAARLPAGAGGALARAAGQAYAHGMAETAVVSAIVLVVATGAVHWLLPRAARQGMTRPEDQPAPTMVEVTQDSTTRRSRLNGRLP